MAGVRAPVQIQLTTHATVWVDLERTYAAAAVDAYVE
jgi:hypothetical protein